MSEFTQKSAMGMRVNIALLLFTIFLSLNLAELMARGLQYFQYVNPSNRVQRDQYGQIYSDERNKSYVFGHKPNVNVKLTKGYYDFTFITNSEGLREAKDYQNLDKSIIFLGDSIVEGASVENNESMDEVFERHAGIPTLNFGVGSFNTVHEFFWLQSKYKNSYNTKLIVLGFCLNDFPHNNHLRYFDPSLGNWLLHKYLNDNIPATAILTNEGISKDTLWHKAKEILKKSELIMFLGRSRQNVFQKNAVSLPPYRFDEVDEESRRYTELYIDKIRKFSDGIGSEFAVVIFPQESQFKHEYDSHMRMQDALIQILQNKGIKYIDLYHFMRRNYLTRPDIRWYHDDAHPYKEGHRLIGEYLAQKLPALFPDVFTKDRGILHGS